MRKEEGELLKGVNHKIGIMHGKSMVNRSDPLGMHEIVGIKKSNNIRLQIGRGRIPILCGILLFPTGDNL
jgi:hypothetical protein